MDWERAILLITAIVSALAALYPIIIGREPVRQVLPQLFRHRRAKQLALAMAVTGFISLFFLLIVIPSSRLVIDWVRVGSTALAEPVDQPETPLILHYDPDRRAYTPSSLLTPDTFPTALAIKSGPEQKTFYVGTYGAGVFSSENIPEWQPLGLDDMVITSLRTNRSGELIAATNLGIFVTADNGTTWRHMGPVRDLVTKLAIDPGREHVWLAGTLGGLYRSLDSGATWVGPYLREEIVTEIEFSSVIPQQVYVSLLGNAIYRSDDSGENWLQVREADQQGSAPLAVSQLVANTLYIGPGRQGLYQSKNMGQSWIHLGLRGTSVSTIVTSSTVPGLVMVGTDSGHGIFVSFNEGETWQNYGSVQEEVLSIIEDTTIPGTFIATTRYSGLITSSNFGRTWASMGLQQFSSTSVLSIRDMIAFEDDPNDLLAISVTQPGMVESKDGGRSWSALSGLDEYRRVGFHRIFINRHDANQIFLSGMGGLVLESTDRGTTWRSITGNLPREGYAPIALGDDGTMYAGPGGYGVWIRRLGEEWQTTGLSAYSIQDIWVANNGSRIIALDESSNLHYSHDSADSWAIAPYQFSSVAADPHDANVILGVTADYEILRSLDAGRSWLSITSIPPSADIFGARIRASFDQPTRFYLTSARSLIISQDAGQSWQEASLPQEGRLFVSSQGHLYLSGHGSFYSSDNYGAFWTEIQSGTVVAPSGRVHVMNRTTQLLNTVDNGVLISTDDGETWRPTSIGPGVAILGMSIMDRDGSQQAVALTREQGRVMIMVTNNGSVWGPRHLPCQASSGNLDPMIRQDGGESWLVFCGGQDSLMAVNPSSIDWEVIPVPSNLSFISDARVESSDVAYIISSGFAGQVIYMTLDGGSNWIEGRLSQNARWELVHDLRSEAVITSRQGLSTTGSYSARVVTSALAYIAWLILTIIVLLCVFKPSILSWFWKDVRNVANWLLNPTVSLDRDHLHRAYAWVAWPIMLLTTLLIVQTMPDNSITIMVLRQSTRDSIIIDRIATLIMNFPVSLTTVNGVQFLALLLVTVAIAIAIALIVAFIGKLAAVFLGGQSGNPRKEVIINVISVILLGALLLTMVGFLPTSYSGSSGSLMGFEIVDVFNLFRLYIFFQIIGLTLDVVAQRYRVSPVMLALICIGIVVLFTVLAGMIITSLLPSYPITGQAVARATPLNTFAIVSTLILIIYAMRHWHGGVLQLSKVK